MRFLFLFFFFLRSGILSTSHLKCLKDRGDHRKLLVVVMVWGRDRWVLQQRTDYAAALGWRNGVEWKASLSWAGKGNYITLLATPLSAVSTNPTLSKFGFLSLALFSLPLTSQHSAHPQYPAVSF